MSEASDGGGPGQEPKTVAGRWPPDPAAQPRRPIWRRRSVLIPVLIAVAAAIAAAILAPGAPPGPYTSLPAPCALVPAATLARYVPPFATAKPEHVPPLVGCDWISNAAIGERELVVLVMIYSSSSTARQLFADNARVDQFRLSPGVTASVTRPSVTGLGDQAAAQVAWLRTDVPPPTPSVDLEVLSRNADLTVTYGFNVAGTDPLPTGPQMLSDAIAVARAVLAVLASHD
jgi:hypothetical protein